MKTAFVDTNILVYAASESGVESRKRQIAREITLLPHLCISVQVLNEFISCARNPKKLNLPRQQEIQWLQEWFCLTIADLTIADFQTALEIHLRYQLSHWDSLIVASAISLNCSFLYSEDMQHGLMIEGLEIINPFLEETAQS
jgi:predicted nucleic acid-binding protein